MKFSFSTNIAIVTALVLGLVSSGGQHAEANKYKSKGALAASVTKRTGSMTSTVVGTTKDGRHSYVRSERMETLNPSYMGRPSPLRTLVRVANFKTRLVNNKTGKITFTSDDHAPEVVYATQLHANAGATPGPFYGLRPQRGAMTANGNIRSSARTIGAPRSTSVAPISKKFIAVLNKTGTVKQVRSAPSAGANGSR